MAKTRTILLIAFMGFMTNFFAVYAFEAANPYWLALKPKLKAYLSKNINTSTYSYTIHGPARDLKNFLGNRPDVEIRFSNLNLKTQSMRKTILANAYDTSGKKLETLPIYIDVKVYKQVLTLKRPLQKGEEITPSNISKTTIAIDPRDARSYYDSNLIQKVANRNMAAGTPIKFNQIRHEKLIQVGDSLKVANKNKLIVLEFVCKAMRSGDLGDTITVHCPDLQSKSKKVKIISESEAEFV